MNAMPRFRAMPVVLLAVALLLTACAANNQRTTRYNEICQPLSEYSSSGSGGRSEGNSDGNTKPVGKGAVLRPSPIPDWYTDGSTANDIALDRKSTRLNSSHGYISYAVFC